MLQYIADGCFPRISFGGNSSPGKAYDRDGNSEQGGHERSCYHGVTPIQVLLTISLQARIDGFDNP